MTFTFKMRPVNGIVVMELSGNMVIGGPLAKLQAEINEALLSGSKQFAFHMGAVQKMDSTGLKVLVDCYTKTREKNGGLVLFCVTERIKTILLVTSLLRVFKTFDDEQTALASFNAP